jgi:hypothetical protein
VRALSPCVTRTHARRTCGCTPPVVFDPDGSSRLCSCRTPPNRKSRKRHEHIRWRTASLSRAGFFVEENRSSENLDGANGPRWGWCSASHTPACHLQPRSFSRRRVSTFFCRSSEEPTHSADWNPRHASRLRAIRSWSIPQCQQSLTGWLHGRRGGQEQPAIAVHGGQLRGPQSHHR